MMEDLTTYSIFGISGIGVYVHVKGIPTSRSCWLLNCLYCTWIQTFSRVRGSHIDEGFVIISNFIYLHPLLCTRVELWKHHLTTHYYFEPMVDLVVVDVSFY